MLEIAATCLVITALLAYLNHRYVGMPTTIGTLASTLVVAFGIWIVLPLVGVQLAPMYCLLFGALISPTNPERNTVVALT